MDFPAFRTREIAAAFEALKREGCTFILLRGEQALEIPQKDFDCMVDESHIASACKLLDVTTVCTEKGQLCLPCCRKVGIENPFEVWIKSPRRPPKVFSGLAALKCSFEHEPKCECGEGGV